MVKCTVVGLSNRPTLSTDCGLKLLQASYPDQVWMYVIKPSSQDLLRAGTKFASKKQISGLNPSTGELNVL